MGERIDPRALGAFVTGLERGLEVLEAAKAAGVHPSTLYRLRKKWPAFAATWDEAVEKSSAPVLIRCANRRLLQKRRHRRIRFTPERKEKFLAHFAATCDSTASAAAAGVCKSTVEKHLARDQEFAEGWQVALETGYACLEAELVAEQRAARQAYRIVPDPEALSHPPDFDKAFKLLSLKLRKDGRVGRRDSAQPSASKAWTFDEAILALEKRLKALGLMPKPPPD